MTDVKELITEHLDIWLTAETEKKSGRGRSSGSSNSIYGVQKLRELILELAVTGKLVKNITYKNDAKVLINQIKVDLSKSNIKYKIPKPRDLPKGWAWAFIDEIAESNIGLTYSPKDVSLHGVPVLRSSNIQNGKIDLNDLVRVNTVIKDNLWVQENDLLICARNGSKRLVGKTAKISGLNEPMTFGAFMAILRSPLNDYLEVFLKSPLFRKELDSVETTTINQITQKNLKNTVVPIPPKEIQTVIVKKVDELMQLCDQLEQQQNLSLEAHDQLVDTFLSVLINSSDVDDFKQNWNRISENFDLLFTTEYSVEQLKQTILQLAVMGKLVKQDPNDEPASELLKQIAEEKAKLVKEGKIKKSKPLPEIMDEEKPFEVPNGWEWVRISDIAQIIEYGTSYKTNDNDSVPVYRMGNIQNGSLLEENLKYLFKGCDDLPRLYLKKGDILFNRTNSYELVGKSAVYLGEDNHATFASYLIRVRLYPTINPIFINQVINSPYYRTTQIEPEITQQCGQANFNGTKLASTVIPLPNLLMQTKIIEKLKEIYSLIDNLNLLFLELRKNKVLLADSLVNNALADLKHKENPQSTNNIIQFEKPIEAVKQPKQKSADQIDLFADDSGEDDIKLLSLAAEITFQLHTEPTFGHLKLQKLIYLCQQLKHMDLAADFKQHAAGPYDRNIATYIDTEFKKRQWFSYHQYETPKYKQLRKCSEHRADFNRFFEKEASGIYDLIGLFRTCKSDHIEIVATLFACWLRLLKKKLSVTEEQLLKDFYAWSEEKNRFSQAEVLNSYKWMKQNSVVPL